MINPNADDYYIIAIASIYGATIEDGDAVSASASDYIIAIPRIDGVEGSDMDAASSCCIPQLNTAPEAVLKYSVGWVQDIQFFGGAVLIVYVLLPQSPRRCLNETVVLRS
jgi:hypothetical protein